MNFFSKKKENQNERIKKLFVKYLKDDYHRKNFIKQNYLRDLIFAVKFRFTKRENELNEIQKINEILFSLSNRENDKYFENLKNSNNEFESEIQNYLQKGESTQQTKTKTEKNEFFNFEIRETTPQNIIFQFDNMIRPYFTQYIYNSQTDHFQEIIKQSDSFYNDKIKQEKQYKIIDLHSLFSILDKSYVHDFSILTNLKILKTLKNIDNDSQFIMSSIGTIIAPILTTFSILYLKRLKIYPYQFEFFKKKENVLIGLLCLNYGFFTIFSNKFTRFLEANSKISSSNIDLNYVFGNPLTHEFNKKDYQIFVKEKLNAYSESKIIKNSANEDPLIENELKKTKVKSILLYLESFIGRDLFDFLILHKMIRLYENQLFNKNKTFDNLIDDPHKIKVKFNEISQLLIQENFKKSTTNRNVTSYFKIFYPCLANNRQKDFSDNFNIDSESFKKKFVNSLLNYFRNQLLILDPTNFNKILQFEVMKILSPSQEKNLVFYEINQICNKIDKAYYELNNLYKPLLPYINNLEKGLIIDFKEFQEASEDELSIIESNFCRSDFEDFPKYPFIFCLIGFSILNFRYTRKIKWI